MTALATTPATFQMASTETLPLRFDTTPLLEGAETPSSPAVTLTNLLTGQTYAAGLSGAASVSTVYITQSITALEPKQKYRLAITFQAAAGKIWTMELEISVPF